MLFIIANNLKSNKFLVPKILKICLKNEDLANISQIYLNLEDPVILNSENLSLKPCKNNIIS